MSLMGKVCCGTNHSAQCDCLPSSLSIGVPAWTYLPLNASYAGGTVIVYKCCFNYDDGNYAVPPYNYTLYRATPIIVGTITLNNNCTSDIYFCMSINLGAWSGDPVCTALFVFKLIYAFRGGFPPDCTPDVSNIKTITALTACDGASSNNLCSYNNTWIQSQAASWWNSIPCPYTQAFSGTSSIIYLTNPCEFPASVSNVGSGLFGPDKTFTIT